MPASSALAPATSGVLFGAALAAAGVASPAVIISQLRLENFHMLEVFLTATASSALIIFHAKRAALSACPARSPAAWGYFPYDGNAVGAALLGAGMALTGSCPGTVMVQVGMGLRSGFEVLGGSLLGGVLFAGYGAAFKRPVPPQPEDAKKSPAALTVYDSLRTRELPAVLAFQALCAAVVVVAMRYLPDSQASLRNPVAGGLLMGLSQLSSLLLTRGTLGVSSAYEVVGRHFWRLVGRADAKPLPSLSSVFFAAGIAAGSAAFWALSGTPIPISEAPYAVTTGRAVLGGVLMAVGSRVAGGCTSGHGISGMATLSWASFVSVAAMFGGGIGLAFVLKGLGI